MSFTLDNCQVNINTNLPRIVSSPTQSILFIIFFFIFAGGVIACNTFIEFEIIDGNTMSDNDCILFLCYYSTKICYGNIFYCQSHIVIIFDMKLGALCFSIRFNI